MTRATNFQIILIVLIRPGSKSNTQSLTRGVKKLSDLNNNKVVTTTALMRTTTVTATEITTEAQEVMVLITTKIDTTNRRAAATGAKGRKARHVIAGMCECELIVIISNYRQDRQETTSRLSAKQKNKPNQLWTPSTNHSRQIFLVSYIKQFQMLACSRL